MIAKTLNIRSFVAKTHLSRFTLFFSDNKCPLFTRLGGGGSPKGDNVPFFYRFFISGLPLVHNTDSGQNTRENNLCDEASPGMLSGWQASGRPEATATVKFDKLTLV